MEAKRIDEILEQAENGADRHEYELDCLWEDESLGFIWLEEDESDEDIDNIDPELSPMIDRFYKHLQELRREASFVGDYIHELRYHIAHPEVERRKMAFEGGYTVWKEV